MKNSITGIADEKRFKRFMSLLTVLFILCAGFAVLSVPVTADISIAGFLVNVAGAVAVWYCLVSAKKMHRDIASAAYPKIIALLKILEYVPFIFLIGFILNRAGNSSISYALDFIAVIIWVTVLVLAIMCSRMLSGKKIDRLLVIEKTDDKRKKKYFHHDS